MSIKDRLIKNSTIQLTASLDKSEVYGKKDVIPTESPLINIALSGYLHEGITSGLTAIAGPSRHFKTNFSLFIASYFLKKYPESVLLFYDSEFGSPQGYFVANGIDPSRVVHTPIKNIEELRHDIINQLEAITRNDKVFIIVDSIGNLASKKEVDDAVEGKTVEDMSRAKKIKSLFRIVTPYLTLNDIPMIVVNHTYAEISLYPRQIMSGGTGPMLSSDTVWVLGRAQEKDGSDITGYKFIINIEKSRFIKERSKIPITVSYDKGILKYSGLLELALESGHIIKPKNGWYALASYNKDNGDKAYRENDLNLNEDFWKELLTKTDFGHYIENKYRLPTRESIPLDDELKSYIEE